LPCANPHALIDTRQALHAKHRALSAKPHAPGATKQAPRPKHQVPWPECPSASAPQRSKTSAKRQSDKQRRHSVCVAGARPSTASAYQNIIKTPNQPAVSQDYTRQGPSGSLAVTQLPSRFFFQH